MHRMRAERQFFLETLDKLSEEETCTVALHVEWTAKDIVAHLAAWERQLTLWLRAARLGSKPDLPAPGTWGPYMDDFNARCYRDNCHRTLADVMAESEQAFREVMAELEALPDDPNHPSWALWLGGRPPWALLVSFHDHYRSHGQPIFEWLARSGRG